MLVRNGAFWHNESYDHVVRDEGEFERVLLYIRNNPVKAGLVSEGGLWPFTYSCIGINPKLPESG
jgi:putative DNA methylase